MELQGQRRVLQRPAVAATLSTEYPRLAAAIGNTATFAVADVVSATAVANQNGKAASGMLAKIKQAGLRVDAAESALNALTGSDTAQSQITDVLTDIHDIQDRLKRTEHV